MEILVLGAGGFDNEGLPFNSFLVDGHLLVDCPPDILVSLGREGLSASAIDSVFISHTHGDHLFGLPFLLFHFWKRGLQPPRLIGPSDLEEALLAAAALAISPDHPYMAWMREYCGFEIVGRGPAPALAGSAPEFYRTWHAKETWGLGLRRGGRLLFQYIPDTSWDPGLLAYLGLGAELLVCDVNGSGGVKSVHMSREDLETALASLSQAQGPARPPLKALGTHLSAWLEEGGGRLGTVHPGMRLRLGADRTQSLIEELSSYALRRPPEAATSQRIADFLSRRPDAFLRSCLEGHITGSAFIVDSSRSRTLFVHHVKLDRWLQPGGHCEEGETAFEAACREAKEETGLEVSPLLGGELFDIDIHAIPARAEVPAHLHYDLRYLFSAQEGAERASAESHALRWLAFAEAPALNPEESIRRPIAKLEELA